MNQYKLYQARDDYCILLCITQAKWPKSKQS